MDHEKFLREFQLLHLIQNNLTRTFICQCGFELYDHNSDPQENVNLAIMKSKDPKIMSRINDHFMMLKAGWRATHLNLLNQSLTPGMLAISPTSVSAINFREERKNHFNKPLIRSNQEPTYNSKIYFDASFALYFIVIIAFIILWVLMRRK